MSPANAPNPNRRSERSRLAVLSACAELVSEVGFARLTVEAIAARAGVGKQTIYRWWPSKGAVVFDALLEMNRADGDLALPDTGDLDVDLRTVIRAMVSDLTDPRTDAVYRAVFAEIQSDERLATELTQRLLSPLTAAISTRLAAGRATGEVSPHVDLSVGLELIIGPVFHRWLLRTGPLDHAYADTLAHTVIRALEPHTAPD
jgi:AcrR family transcriptional regulator